MVKEAEISKNGIDNILGWETVENQKIPVIEDTFVQGAGTANQNFGSDEVLEHKAIASNGSAGTHRITLLKFDISELSDDDLSRVNLVFNVFEMEQPNKPRVIKVYSCDPYAWDE